MKLPHPEKVIIDSQKLSGYCLNPNHIEGRHKARVFRSVLGLKQEDEHILINALKQAIISYDAVFDEEITYGNKYIIDFSLTINNKTAIIHSVWIVRKNENFPRLITCYIL